MFFLFSLAGNPELTSCFLHAEELVNFHHLDMLEYNFKDETGKEYTSWAIYAEPVDENDLSKGYQQVEASGEGYACVDDVARIAIILLSRYEKYGDSQCVEKAKKALEFILYMADGSGEYYNFAYIDGRINKKGKTSRADMDWWTARAFYALATGKRIIGDNDPELVDRIDKANRLTINNLLADQENPKFTPEAEKEYTKRGMKPGSLVNDSGTITSIITLGLLEEYRVSGDEQVKNLLFEYCNAMEALEETSFEEYPFTGFHYNTLRAPDMIHFYGNRQVEALATAGKMFNNKKWIESAVNEANIGYPKILTSWGLPFALSPDPEIYPQIAYTAETIITNLMAVYKVTGGKKYAVLGGLFASWFFGDNPFRKPLCIPGKGRCFDGIDEHGISKNAGAESVIESLLALDQIEGTPAEEYINFKTEKTENCSPICVYLDEFSCSPEGARLVTRKFTGGYEKQAYILEPGTRVFGKVRIETPEKYRIYVSYQLNNVEDSDKAHSEILCTINHIPVKLRLFSTNERYRNRFAFPGEITIDSPGDLEISFENKGSNKEIILSTVIVQPEVQVKNMTNGSDRFRMIMNCSRTIQTIKPDDIDLNREDIVFSSDGKTNTLKPGEWIMVKTG
jgi:hypothetical protein